MTSAAALKALRAEGWRVYRESRDGNLILRHSKKEKEVTLPHPKAKLSEATVKYLRAATGVDLK